MQKLHCSRQRLFRYTHPLVVVQDVRQARDSFGAQLPHSSRARTATHTQMYRAGNNCDRPSTSRQGGHQRTDNMHTPLESRAVNSQGAAAESCTTARRDDRDFLKELVVYIGMRRGGFGWGRHAKLQCCSIVLGFVLAASAPAPPPDRHPPPGSIRNSPTWTETAANCSDMHISCCTLQGAMPSLHHMPSLCVSRRLPHPDAGKLPPPPQNPPAKGVPPPPLESAPPAQSPDPAPPPPLGGALHSIRHALGSLGQGALHAASPCCTC
jgi:hypothetical protein